MESNSEVQYSGFFSRLIALVLDTMILSVPLKLLSDIFGEDSHIYMTLLVTLWWLYTSYSIYKWKGTLGKRIIGLYVLRIDTNPLSFQQASLRYFFSILIYLPLILFLAISVNIEIENENLLWIVLFLILSPFFMMFFNQKRQTLYDYLAKTIVVDSVTNILGQPNTIERTPNPNTRPTALQKSIRGLAGLAILILMAYVIFYFVLMYIGFSGHGKSSDNPITSAYKTVEYNNTKIDFYKTELEKASAQFIEADSMYEILHGDVKRDLALNCIAFFIKKAGNEDWRNESYKYRDNARNKYANTTERVKKAKKNESYLGHHFYDYDFGDIHHIEEEIANEWDVNGNKQTCEKTVSANDMYAIFLDKYIKNREETKIRWLDDQSRRTSNKDKRFWSKQIDKIDAWIEELYKKSPNYLKKKAEEAKALEIEIRRVEQEYKKTEAINKKHQNVQNKIIYEQDVQRGVPPIFAAIQNHLDEKLFEILDGGADIEMKNKFGTTPLSFAIYQHDDNLVKILLDYGANPNVIDGNGLYSPLSEVCVTNRVSTAKLLLQHGADVNYQHNKSETALTVAAKSCKNFEMVKLLLENGADPMLEDRFSNNLFIGLKRYCRDNKQYQKMDRFIKQNKLF